MGKKQSTDRIKITGYETTHLHKECGTYTLEHVSIGKVYHGSTDDIHRRLIEHRGELSRREHRNPLMQVCSDADPCFRLEFRPTETIQDARTLEIKLIEETDKTCLLNVMHSHNPEVMVNISQARLGNQNALGKIHTEEHRRAAGLRMAGNKHLLGHRHSEETKAKMVAAHVGHKPTMEHIAASAAGRTRNHVMVDNVQYFNAPAAAKAIGVTDGTIRKRCNSPNFSGYSMIVKESKKTTID